MPRTIRRIGCMPLRSVSHGCGGLESHGAPVSGDCPPPDLRHSPDGADQGCGGGRAVRDLAILLGRVRFPPRHITSNNMSLFSFSNNKQMLL